MPTYRKATNKDSIDYEKPWAGIVHWRNMRYFLGHYASIEEAEIGEIEFKLGMLEDRKVELEKIIAERKGEECRESVTTRLPRSVTATAVRPRLKPINGRR